MKCRQPPTGTIAFNSSTIATVFFWLTLIYYFRERDWISVGDVGTALDFVFFAVVSFFGVGNIASLNRSAYSTLPLAMTFLKGTYVRTYTIAL